MGIVDTRGLRTKDTRAPRTKESCTGTGHKGKKEKERPSLEYQVSAKKEVTQEKRKKALKKRERHERCSWLHKKERKEKERPAQRMAAREQGDGLRHELRANLHPHARQHPRVYATQRPTDPVPRGQLWPTGSVGDSVGEREETEEKRRC